MASVIPIPVVSPSTSRLIEQYGCGAVHFSGTDNELYERHLIFDNVIDLTATESALGMKRLPIRSATFFPSDGSVARRIIPELENGNRTEACA